ncbi:hypothetical protein ACFVXH_27405 [Kitasatospora sp. NPDC058184]|uniref:hypothetical protein n=1 Tax=Kitasatospora sp. NPDC058184 TaxID=3346370 RepID=UPI0036D7BEA2
MTPLGLSVATWWWIVALTTVLFWAMAIPPQVTRQYRIMVALAPLVGALFLVGRSHMNGTTSAGALSMYALAMLSLTLGTAGHLGRMARLQLASDEAGDRDEVPLTWGFMVQFFLCVTAGFVVYFVIQP